MRVVVLAGGRSSEHDVSLASGNAVATGLRRGGHEVIEVTIGRDGRWTADASALSLAPGQGLLGADVVFPVLHGPFGEDGTLQGLLESLAVAYVGAGVLASALCMDKLVFKQLLDQAQIPQVRYRGALHGRWTADRAGLIDELRGLGLPVFVKPARLGSSLGIAKVSHQDELADALDRAFVHDERVIVEAMAHGLELECSVIGTTHAPECSLPGEISLTSEWYDYEAKYTPGGMELIVPARVDAGTSDRVRALAAEVFSHSGCSGLARVDFFVTDTEVLVNELNTMPGFTETSVFGRLFEATGLPYVELLERLIELACQRFEAEQGFVR